MVGLTVILPSISSIAVKLTGDGISMAHSTVMFAGGEDGTGGRSLNKYWEALVTAFNAVNIIVIFTIRSIIFFITQRFVIFIRHYIKVSH